MPIVNVPDDHLFGPFCGRVLEQALALSHGRRSQPRRPPRRAVEGNAIMPIEAK
jgi:hypothetical protein